MGCSAAGVVTLTMSSDLGLEHGRGVGVATWHVVLVCYFLKALLVDVADRRDFDAVRLVEPANVRLPEIQSDDSSAVCGHVNGPYGVADLCRMS